MICSTYHTKCKCLSKSLCSEGGKAGVWEDQMAACLKKSQEQLLAGLARAEKVFKCIYCSSVTLVHPNGHLTHQTAMWSLFILMMSLNKLGIRAPTHLLYHPKHVFPPAAIWAWAGLTGSSPGKLLSSLPSNHIWRHVLTACINNRSHYLQYYLKCVKGSMQEQQHVTVSILLISFSYLLYYTLSLKHHNCVFGSDCLQTCIALTIPHIFYTCQYPFRGITNRLEQIFSFMSTLSVPSPCWRSELDWCLREI